MLFSFYCYFARNVQPQGDCPYGDHFLSVFGSTRSLQLSQVAFGLPLLQLEAGPYHLPGSYHFAWMPSSAAGDAAGRLDQSFGRLGGNGLDPSWWPAQLRVYTMVHPVSAAGSPAQPGPRVYTVAARNAAGPHQTSSSRWPRLPLGGRGSCGIRSRPTRELQLAGSPSSPLHYAAAAHLSPAILLSRHTGRSAERWPRLLRVVGATAGRTRTPGIVQLRLASSRCSPRWRSLLVA